MPIALEKRVEALSPMERVIQTLINTKDHVFHGRPGVEIAGAWRPLNKKDKEEIEAYKKFALGEANVVPKGGKFLKSGIFIPAAVILYQQLVDIWKADNELAARLASYALLETDHKDLKVMCAALMLVQNRAGQTIKDPEGNFNDEDFRDTGAAMLGYYEQGSKLMFNPKMILDVLSLLALPEINAINKATGFGDPQSKRPSHGRWPAVARGYLRFRELNPKMLESGVKAGFKSTLQGLAKKSRYKPLTQRFFEILKWPQVQTEEGHRTIGLEGLDIQRQTFVGLNEAQVVEKITTEKLGYKMVMGMLTPEVGLSPNVMKALLPGMTDKDVVLLIPTLEDLGLLKDKTVKARIDKALKDVDDERARNIAKNVRSKELKGQMEAAADGALAKAVNKEIAEKPLKILIGIDASGSMEGSIVMAKDVVGRLLPAFTDQKDKISVQIFSTDSKTVKFKQYTKTGVSTALAGYSAGGGTLYGSTFFTAAREGFKVEPGEDLIVLFIGDEQGEPAERLKQAMEYHGLKPAAMAIVPVFGGHYGRGSTVRDCARLMRVPLTEVDPKMIPDGDPYQMVRFLRNFLAAAIPTGPAAAPRREVSLVEKLLKVDILTTANRKVLLAPVKG
jgi:hypothetical protein